MQKNLNEWEAFWDDFAQQYEEIRQESSFPVAEDLTEFLLNMRILPSDSFLDMAGGPGIYLRFFQNYVKKYTLVDLSKEMLQRAQKHVYNEVTFVHSAQQSFLKKATPYQVVFSAMNPALQTKKELLDLMKLATDWFLIFRLIKEEDSLFSQYERITDENLLLNEQYKAYLAEAQIPYRCKLFSYQQTEVITKEFFLAYFADIYSKADLLKLSQRHFGERETITMENEVTYELLYVDCR